MNDLISRQAAIDTEGLDEEIRCEICRNPMHTSRGCDGNCTYDEKLYEKIMQILDRRIKQLPSAQPEQRWIPCSERLPRPYEQVLRTVKSFGWNCTSHTHVDIGTIYPIDTDVIAWMPLPEQYTEERTEE